MGKKAMSNINFRPWVGKNYLTTGCQGKRVLVLGESHYCIRELSAGGRCYPNCKRENMDNTCFSQTNDVVEDFVYHYQGARYLQAFLCFERAMAGKVLTQSEREEFWNGVMFYNYIQYAQSGPRIAPHTSHWGDSEKAFVELMETYRPDYIIVWGVRLFDSLPRLGGEGRVVEVGNGDKINTWIYPLFGKGIPVLKMHHPSSPTGKNWRYWHRVINCFFSIK